MQRSTRREPTTISVQALRRRTTGILKQVKQGRRFVVTVSSHEVAELGPVTSRPYFVARSVVESILREAPLDRAFLADVEGAIGQRISEI